MRSWAKQADLDAGRRSDGLTSEQLSEMAQLRKELREAREERDILKRGGFLRPGDPVNVYPFIEAEKVEDRNVTKACELMEVSRSAFYDWHAHRPSRREVSDAEFAGRGKSTASPTTWRGCFGRITLTTGSYIWSTSRWPARTCLCGPRTRSVPATWAVLDRRPNGL